MPHKRVSPDATKRIEETVASYEQLINNINAFNRNDKSSINTIVEGLRQFEEKSGMEKDAWLKIGTQESWVKAVREQGKQEAFQDVLVLIENPELIIGRLVNEMNRYKEILKDYREKDNG